VPPRIIRAISRAIFSGGSIKSIQPLAVRGRWPPIKIIVTSGQVRVREEDLPSGVFFFGKPYRPEQITKKLRKMAGKAA
jgi:hypothetical protein